MECLSDRQLRRLKSGELAHEVAEGLASHLAGCESCRARMEALRGTTQPGRKKRRRRTGEHELPAEGSEVSGASKPREPETDPTATAASPLPAGQTPAPETRTGPDPRAAEPVGPVVAREGEEKPDIGSRPRPVKLGEGWHVPSPWGAEATRLEPSAQSTEGAPLVAPPWAPEATKRETPRPPSAKLEGTPRPALPPAAPTKVELQGLTWPPGAKAEGQGATWPPGSAAPPGGWAPEATKLEAASAAGWAPEATKLEAPGAHAGSSRSAAPTRLEPASPWSNPELTRLESSTDASRRGDSASGVSESASVKAAPRAEAATDPPRDSERSEPGRSELARSEAARDTGGSEPGRSELARSEAARDTGGSEPGRSELARSEAARDTGGSEPGRSVLARSEAARDTGGSEPGRSVLARSEFAREGAHGESPPSEFARGESAREGAHGESPREAGRGESARDGGRGERDAGRSESPRGEPVRYEAAVEELRADGPRGGVRRVELPRVLMPRPGPAQPDPKERGLAPTEPSTALEVAVVRRDPRQPAPVAGGKRPGVSSPEGAQVGNYLLLEPLWTTDEPCELFAAYDQLHDRRVTLRILELEGETAKAAEKLLSDARALQQVEHPALPKVLDITTRGSQALIAFEPEDGALLDVWLAAGRRSRSERIQLFIGVANALAVLHQSGVIHGGLRPAAIRISANGSIRLTELSVMRPIRQDVRSGRRLSSGSMPNAARSAHAYAAPERRDLVNVDWRAEQFSFCALFFEALTGELPYPSEASALQNPAAGKKLPGWLRALLVQGLSRVREQRHESMRLLAAELRKKRKNPLWQAAWVGAGALAALVVVGGGVWLFRRETPMPAATSCSEASARTRKAWNDARREEVRAGLLGTRRPFAEKTATGVDAALEAYVRGWEHSFQAVCAAPSHPAGAAVRLCLEQRMLDFEALTDAFAHAEARVAIRAQDAARTLADPTECASGPILGRKLPDSPPAAWTRAVSEAMRHLAKARAYAETDQPWRAPAELARALELSTSAPDAWLGAEVLVLQGTVKARQADGPNAERVLRRGLLQAQGAGNASGAARAAGQLGYVHGVLLGRRADAEHAFEQAFAHAGYVADDALTARLLLIRSSVYEALRQPARAFEDAEKSLSLLKGRGEATVHSQAVALNAMGRAAAAQGKTEEALTHQQASLALLEGSMGPDHPEVARALEAIALIHLTRRELDRARPLLERATAMRDAALGAEDPNLGTTLRLLCDLYGDQRAWGKAEECLARAVAVEEKRQSDAGLVPTLLDLARVHEAQQRPQLALSTYLRAATLSERMTLSSQPSVSAALRGMASAYLTLKEPEKARVALERVVALGDANGADIETTVRARLQLARLLKGPMQRTMMLKARDEALRCGTPCAALLRELDGGAARLPVGPSAGTGIRAPRR